MEAGEEAERLDAFLAQHTDLVAVLDGPHVEICFQKVDPPPVTKKPLHLDVATGDRASEIRRLVSLGASVMERFERHLDAGSRGQRLLRRRRVAQRVVRRGPLQPLAARQALCARGADVRWTP